MAAKVLTTAQITTLVEQLIRRLARLEKIMKNQQADDDSGSFQSLVTSLSGGKGSVSVSWSAEKERSFDDLTNQTTGTGSASISLPELEGLAGA